ncbi:mycofactocin precursor MftA [Rhodococcus sp. NPDC076796]
MSKKNDSDVTGVAVVESDLVEESLVEEVSIDGMCGVY